MKQAIFYRHYDLHPRFEQSKLSASFWIVTPMTTAMPVTVAVMDDFGTLVNIRSL